MSRPNSLLHIAQCMCAFFLATMFHFIASDHYTGYGWIMQGVIFLYAVAQLVMMGGHMHALFQSDVEDEEGDNDG